MGKQRPLTSQFNFFLMPEETNRFLKEFSVDGISVFEDRSETNTPKAVEDIEKSWHMKFCPSELVPNIIMHRAGELFFIDRSVSPVIEYSGCTLSQDKLYRGRIRVETGYDGRDGYEAPENPELRLTTPQLSLDAAADAVIATLRLCGVIAD